MNSILIAAVVVVTFALVLYSIAVISEQRKSAVSKRILGFFTAGVVCDISSTFLMIIGSINLPFTGHGFLGYSALTLMLIDTILVWRHWHKNKEGKLSRRLNNYTRVAYGWWVVAYIVGAALSTVLGR